MATLDNKTRLAQPTDVGLKLSKPGYDANHTSGSNLIYNSSWPSLQTVFEKTIPNPITSPPATSTVPHPLKYPPLTFIWAIGPDPSGLTGAPAERRINTCADVDTNNIYLRGLGMSGIEDDFLFTATTLHIKCFQIDLTKDIDYILAPGDQFKAPYDPNFGIKIVKQNKDINSKDLRDFSVHSRCQSPLVLAVKTQDTNNPANPTVTQYTNKLPYPVWVYAYARSTAGKYRWVPLGGQAYPILNTDGFVSSFQYQTTSGDNGATMIILRDPMFASSQDIVTY